MPASFRRWFNNEVVKVSARISVVHARFTIQIEALNFIYISTCIWRYLIPSWLLMLKLVRSIFGGTDTSLGHLSYACFPFCIHASNI